MQHLLQGRDHSLLRPLCIALVPPSHEHIAARTMSTTAFGALKSYKTLSTSALARILWHFTGFAWHFDAFHISLDAHGAESRRVQAQGRFSPCGQCLKQWPALGRNDRLRPFEALKPL